eukprot:Hpha_TRINITY_DN15136_c3_g6::TRINITY_DN15136_c3_g6_i1::g.129011::m.129011
MGGCKMWCSWLLGLLVKKGDISEEAQMKKIALPVSLLWIVFGIFSAIDFTMNGSRYTLALGAAVSAFGGFFLMAGAVQNVVQLGHCVDVALIISTLGICIMDAATAAFSYSFRTWCYVVLVLDCALVFNRHHIPYFVIPFIILYIAADALESVHNYGLYEFGLWGTDETASQCNCASPPCSVPGAQAGSNLFAVCFVFVIDFYLTRGFARSTRFQLRRVEASVDVAGEIAAALARYDVHTAQRAIADGDDLPGELAESYLHLLSNLRVYRDYLPDTLLGDDDSEGKSLHKAVVPPPEEGEGTGNVAMVFTDIQSSTVLWENDYEGMYEALRTHNTILRGLATENRGY